MGTAAPRCPYCPTVQQQRVSARTTVTAPSHQGHRWVSGASATVSVGHHFGPPTCICHSFRLIPQGRARFGVQKIPKWQLRQLPSMGNEIAKGADGRGKLCRSWGTREYVKYRPQVIYRSPRNEAAHSGRCKNTVPFEISDINKDEPSSAWNHNKRCQVCYKRDRSRPRAKMFCEVCHVLVCSVECFRHQHGLTGATRGLS